MIHRSGEHLLDLINDVLEMSKIEAGHRKLNRGSVDLAAMLDEVARMFRLRADAKRLAFEIDCAREVPAVHRRATRASCGRSSSTCSATR